MTKITSSLFIATVLALGLQVAPAQAQLSRTFVSAASGNDANNCDRPTPCRTFQGAHNKTNSDGEITVLDPGGYGGLTITKSISIVNDGVGEASILVSGGSVGITINAGGAAYVNLRGITIQGIGFGGGTGLVFNSGFTLTMTNCVIRNHTGNGIIFQPASGGHLSLSNTLGWPTMARAGSGFIRPVAPRKLRSAESRRTTIRLTVLLWMPSPYRPLSSPPSLTAWPPVTEKLVLLQLGPTQRHTLW